MEIKYRNNLALLVPMVVSMGINVAMFIYFTSEINKVVDDIPKVAVVDVAAAILEISDDVNITTDEAVNNTARNIDKLGGAGYLVLDVGSVLGMDDRYRVPNDALVSGDSGDSGD